MKRTIIALIALAGVAAAAPQALTLTSPQGAKIEGSNNYVAWSEEYSQLDSWSLSFELLDSSLGNAAIFSTERVGGGGAVGYVLNTTSTGGLSLTNTNNSNVSLLSLDNVITAGTQTGTITLTYVADEADAYYGFYNNGVAAGTILGGTFTLTIGEQIASAYVVSSEHTMLWNGEGHGAAGNVSSRFWTNGGAEKMYSISVAKLDNKLIPEPATATLSLLALAGLAARRRRK